MEKFQNYMNKKACCISHLVSTLLFNEKYVFTGCHALFQLILVLYAVAHIQ